jgi:hypothetical protein
MTILFFIALWKCYRRYLIASTAVDNFVCVELYPEVNINCSAEIETVESLNVRMGGQDKSAIFISIV